jgi:hypothetical protein
MYKLKMVLVDIVTDDIQSILMKVLACNLIER